MVHFHFNHQNCSQALSSFHLLSLTGREDHRNKVGNRYHITGHMCVVFINFTTPIVLQKLNTFSIFKITTATLHLVKYFKMAPYWSPFNPQTKTFTLSRVSRSRSYSGRVSTAIWDYKLSCRKKYENTQYHKIILNKIKSLVRVTTFKDCNDNSNNKGKALGTRLLICHQWQEVVSDFEQHLLFQGCSRIPHLLV